MSEKEPRPFLYERVPEELKQYEQWVNWRMDEDAKVPVNPRTQGNAGVRWPNTWASYDVAAEMAARLELGIGFVLTEDDPYTCVDLDNCVDERRQVGEETRAILDLLCGWVELSPSGTGLHIWVKSEQPVNRRTKGIEVYSDARWMTVTGVSNPRAPLDIPDRTRELQRLIDRYFPDKPSEFMKGYDSQADDEVWQRLFRSRNGSFFRRLYEGDISVCQDDHSRAVIMLANQLAIQTNLDALRMKRMLYQTGLVRPKWEDKRGQMTWIEYQILDAIRYLAGR